MAVSIGELAGLLTAGGLRHHLDAEEGVIRVALVTPRYVNSRSERLAILTIEAPEAGTRCRVSLARAFATGRTAAATCLAVCQASSEVPLVGVEHDATTRSLGLVAEMPVEDGTVTALQLFAMIDRVVEAAEAGQRLLAARGRRGRTASLRKAS